MAILQTTGVTGSLEISSSRIPLSTSASLFNVNGYNGRLFDVVDNLSGSLFNVNTIAGVPVLDVWSDNRVFLGKYNANDFVISGSRVGMGTAFPLAILHVSGSSATSIIDGVRIGRGAGNITTNTVVGNNALISNTTGNKNSAFGYRALNANTISGSNSAFGYLALTTNTGRNNSAFGDRALANNTSGFNNSAFGTLALASNTIGIRNSAFGYRALNANTISGSNSAFGYRALTTNRGGNNNAFGTFTLANNTTGYNNSAFGSLALMTNTIGFGNSAFGTLALASNIIGTGNSAFGNYALNRNISGVNNVAIGTVSLFENLTGNRNVAVGSSALRNNTANNNSAFGDRALASNTTGIRNSAFGYRALNANTISGSNSAFGYLALTTNTGGNNSAFGDRALTNNTSGFNNSAFGYRALNKNTSGVNNVAIGTLSLFENLTGNRNVAVGFNALRNNTTNNNSAFGYAALASNTSGFNNNAFGYLSLQSNTSGFGNSAFGSLALSSNTIGTGNSAFGNYALNRNISGGGNVSIGILSLFENLTGNRNVAVGSSALRNNTTNNNSAFGYRALASNTSGNRNSAFGYRALNANTISGSNSAFGYLALTTNTGRHNSAFGDGSLRSNTNGFNNNAFGHASLANNTIGSRNNAFGVESLRTNVSGNNNNAFGYLSLASNTIGNNNIAFGNSALRTLTLGNRNIAVGSEAGDAISTGNNNIIIGHNIDAPVDAGSNQLNIANLIFASGSAFGQGKQVSTGSFVGIGTTSPSGKLHLRDDTTGPTLILEDRAANNDPFIRFIPNPSNVSFAVGIDDSDGDKFKISYGANNTSTLGTNDRFVIDTSGNVGIGVTNPAARLNVTNTGTIGGSSLANSWLLLGTTTSGLGLDSNEIYGTGGDGLFIGTIDSGSLRFRPNSQDVMTITSTGRVGIGTTSPQRQLQVRSLVTSTSLNSATAFITNYQSTFVDGNYYGGIGIATPGSNGGTVGAGMFGVMVTNNLRTELAFVTKGGDGSTDSDITEKVRITQTGNIGIGTTSPQERLHVSSSAMADLRLEGLTDSTVQFVGPNTHSYSVGIDVSDSDKFKISYASSKTPPILGGGGASDRFVIQTNGRVGIDNGSVAIDGKFQVFHNGGDGSGGNTQIGILNVAASGQSTIGCQTINGDIQSNLLLGSTISGTNRFWLMSKRASTVNEAHALRFYYYNGSTFSSPIVSMETNGNVGVNVTNPLYRLDVGGTARISNDVGIGGIPDSGARLYVQGEDLTEPFLSVQTCFGNNSNSTTTFSSLKGYLAVKIGNNVGVTGALITAGTYYIRLWGT